ncbi:hypothetical protein D3C71_24250 [compost metagenome]
MSPWKLKRTAQCDKCPWRVDVDPRDIPNGYCEQKHVDLVSTIAKSDTLEQARAHLAGEPMHVMACHESQDAHCVGWLMNQLGPGNNIALRMRMRDCENIDRVRLRGEQHQTFADTLPQKERKDS